MRQIAFRRDRCAAEAPRKPPNMIPAMFFRLAAAALLFPALAFAQGSPPTGSAAAGAQKNAMCVGCHGIVGWRTAFPEVYKVPKLGGQHAAYIVRALQEYRNGDRVHPSMRAIASSLSDQDMADLAAYYAGAPATTASK
jgi:cytochrome c553